MRRYLRRSESSPGIGGSALVPVISSYTAGDSSTDLAPYTTLSFLISDTSFVKPNRVCVLGRFGTFRRVGIVGYAGYEDGEGKLGKFQVDGGFGNVALCHKMSHFRGRGVGSVPIARVLGDGVWRVFVAFLVRRGGGFAAVAYTNIYLTIGEFARGKFWDFVGGFSLWFVTKACGACTIGTQFGKRNSPEGSSST